MVQMCNPVKNWRENKIGQALTFVGGEHFYTSQLILKIYTILSYQTKGLQNPIFFTNLTGPSKKNTVFVWSKFGCFCQQQQQQQQICLYLYGSY